MKVTVEFFGQAREAAGLAREVVQVSDGCSVGQLLETLAAARPKLARFLIAADGSISKSLAVARNDRQVQEIDRELLTDNDEVILMPAVSGG